MNLIDAKWIPVRRKSGMHDWISPLQIGDPDIVALDASRADFNGALAQFLIGLLQTTTPMDSQIEWEEYLDAPPSEAMLANWFDPVREAFLLDGDECRYMQDKSVAAEKYSEPSIASLLVDQPRGRDHFVKYGTVVGLCKSCVAAALTNLQFMAPEGGRGYFTSIRGGGPLSTLIISTPTKSLWNDLWLNVMEDSVFRALQGQSLETEVLNAFSWVSSNSVFGGGEVYPISQHPATVFWAKPRRFWIDFDNVEAGVCDVCAREDTLTSTIKERPNGVKYSGWIHPFTPYYEKPKEGWFPFRPKGGDQSYRQWIGWVFEGAHKQTKPAAVINDFLTRKHRSGQFRIWAFGYHMEKANPKAWCEATLPLYGLASHDQRAQSVVQAVAGQWVEAASLVALYLRDAVKQAWFSSGAEVRGDLSHIDSAFYAATEQKFYGLLRQLIETVRDADDDPVLSPLREQWRSGLITATLRLFDNTLVGTAPIERQNPRRIAEAHEALVAKLHGSKLKQVVGLAFVAPEKIKKAKKNSSKIEEA